MSTRLSRRLCLIALFCLAAVVRPASAESPRSFPYVLKYAWFDPHPVRHSEIHDPVIELEKPLANTKRSVATIAYSYPGNRRISFQFAWDRPPQVLEMTEGYKSETYSVPLEIRRGIGGQHIDEGGDISVGSGGHSVDINVGAVCKLLKVERISPETYSEIIYVGFNEKNKRTGVQEGFGKFVLSGAGTNYIKNGVLTADMRYAYIRIYMQCRGGYASAFYIYENEAAGTGGNQPAPVNPAKDFDPAIEILGEPKDANSPVADEGFEREFATPWGTGQYAKGHAPWWTNGGCDARGTFDRSQWHGGGKALHIINRSPRAANVYGTTQMPLQLAAGKKYQVTAWARATGLASAGGASIVVDDDWKLRPIQLPQGTYDWTKFRGTFVLPNSGGQLRILSEDQGEVWFDDVQIEEVK